MMLKTQQLSKSGKTLFYQEDGQGETIVFLHGVGMQSDAWAPQLGYLKQHYHVIALDLPGHGKSDPIAENSLLPDYVAWCHDACTSLNINHATFVGHSMGALITAGYAIEHPQMVDGLALLNGVYKRDDDAKQAVISRANAIRNGEIDIETPLSRWFDDSPINVNARTLTKTWLTQINPQGYATAYNAFARGDDVYGPYLNQISCPFLAVTGENDQNSTSEMSRRMAAEVTNGQWKAVPAHRHMVNLTAPEIINDLMEEWLTTTVHKSSPKKRPRYD